MKSLVDSKDPEDSAANRRPLLDRRVFLSRIALLPMMMSSLLQDTANANASKYGILGQLAPELEVDYWIDAAGEPTSFKLANASGVYTYLYCFQNWCPGCHSHGFPALKKIADAFHEDERVVTVAVQTTFEGFGINTEDKVRKLQLRYELPITMGHDPGDPETHRPPQVMRAYRTGGTPWTVIINTHGRVVFNDFHVDADKVIQYFEKELTAA